MRIYKGFLDAIQDRDTFVREYCSYAGSALRACRLHPVISPPRLIEAHGAWLNDLSRVGNHEPKLDEGLDHFKRCGHLTFWLRRMSPLVEAHDTTLNLGDAQGYPLSVEEVAFRKLLLGYSNEYLAFDYGYQICKYYEIGKPGGSKFADDLVLSQEFYQTTCQFLKYKNVSPHGVHLIFKSVFSH